MHDIDRSFRDMENENFEFSGEYAGEGSYENEGYEGGVSQSESYESESYPGESSESEVLGEGEVEQLAAELLSINSEQELDHFLGSLIKKVGGALGKIVKSPIGRQIGGLLKGLAKQALPVAGAALGNLVVPGIGGAVGGKLASQLGSAFGLELGGLSQEDQHFEVAKQYVRLAGDAIRSALNAPGQSAEDAARSGMFQAAQRYAPGFLPGMATVSGYAGGSSGRWVRRGSKIVLYGV